jgi:hypothetical protein
MGRHRIARYVTYRGVSMARAETKIKEGAAPFLEPGEEVLAGMHARPRGWTQSNASAGGGALAGIVGQTLGGKKQQENTAAAAESGFELANPMALAITDRRLLCFEVGNLIGMGMGGDVKELVSAAPLGEVDSIETKRLGVGLRALEVGRLGGAQPGDGLVRIDHPAELRIEVGRGHP